MKLYIENLNDLRFIPITEKGDSIIVTQPLEIINKIVVPPDVSFLCEEEITVSDSHAITDMAIMIGASDKNSSEVEYAIKLAMTPDWSAQGIMGVLFLNTSDCEMDLDDVSGFVTGVCFKSVGLGTQYNHTNIGKMMNNQSQLLLRSESSGWVNENTFHGGRFGNYSNLFSTLPRSGVTINSDAGEYLNNGNKFHDTCFELNAGAYSVKTTAILIEDGTLNTFENIRIERCNSTEKQVETSNKSVDNVVSVQYSDLGDNEIVENNGSFVGATVNYINNKRVTSEITEIFTTPISGTDNHTRKFELNGCQELSVSQTVINNLHGRRLFKCYDANDTLMDNTNGNLIKASKGQPYYNAGAGGWKTGSDSSTKKRYWVDESVYGLEIGFIDGSNVLSLKSYKIEFKSFNSTPTEV